MSLPDVFGGLSETVTTYATTNNDTWPYVTYPGWLRLSAHVRGLTNTMVVSLEVNVNDPQKWVEYAQAHSEVEISPIIFQLEQNGDIVPRMDGKEQVTVLWLMAFDPAYATGEENQFINHNFLVFPYYNRTVHSIQQLRHGLISSFMETDQEAESGTSDELKSVSDKVSPADNPRSAYLTPVFETSDEGSDIVAYVEGIIDWGIFFNSALLNDDEAIYCIVRNSCDQVHTWLVKASGSQYLGPVSAVTSTEEFFVVAVVHLKLTYDSISILYQLLHCSQGKRYPRKFNSIFVTSDINPYDRMYVSTLNASASVQDKTSLHDNTKKAVVDASGCLYYIDIYPSEDLYESYKTSRPIVYTSVIASIFSVMIMTFVIFNWFIQQRNRKVVVTAARSHAIVSVMFPTNVRDRLYGSNENGSGKRHLAATTGLKDFLTGGEQSDLDEDYMYKSKPIADLFPEVSYTVNVQL
jgi:hypothetical protein